MDRRRALRNIGWGAGALIATPTIMSILNSCKEAGPTFTPVFVSVGQGHALRSMVDLIIPNDEQVPGAVALGVHEFVDQYWKEVLAQNSEDLDDPFFKSSMTNEQQFVKDAFANFEASFKSTFNKELSEGTREDFDQIIAKYLRASKEEKKRYNEALNMYLMAVETDPSVSLDSDAQNYYLLTSIRGLTTWGWKNSEAIGKTVLWYDPVPGQYKGCIPLSEAGNGKAMSL